MAKRESENVGKSCFAFTLQATMHKQQKKEERVDSESERCSRIRFQFTILPRCAHTREMQENYEKEKITTCEM
jgi:hypothetical protein